MCTAYWTNKISSVVLKTLPLSLTLLWIFYRDTTLKTMKYFFVVCHITTNWRKPSLKSGLVRSNKNINHFCLSNHFENVAACLGNRAAQLVASFWTEGGYRFKCNLSLYETYIKVCLVTILKVLKIKRQLKLRQCVLLIYSY